jgi:hypothetical protein
MAVIHCPAGSASGITKTRRGAMYNMGETLATIAVANQSTKPLGIMAASWSYRRANKGVLVKADNVKSQASGRAAKFYAR